MAKAVATVGVSVVARTKNFHKGMKSARRDLKAFTGAVARSTKRIVRFGAALAGAATGALVVLTKRSFKAMDATVKFASRLGLATDELIGLRLAAELSGVGMATLDMALQRMTRRIAEAAQGTGEAKAAIAELGLNAQRLAESGPAKAFADIAEAMQRVGSQSDRVRLSFKLFDSEGVALVNTLKFTRKELEAIAKKAKVLGLTFSEKVAVSIVKANDAVTDMTASFRGLGRTLAGKLSSQVTDIANTITGLAIQLRTLDASAVANIKSWVKWSAAIGVGIIIIPKIIKATVLLVKGIKAITTASITMQAFGGPAGWAAIAAGAAIAATAVIGASRAFDSMAAAASKAFEEAKKLGASVGNISKPGGGSRTAQGGGAALGGGAGAGMAIIRKVGSGMAEAAKRLFDETRTPLENYNKAVKAVGDLFSKGFINVDTFMRKMGQLDDVLDDAFIDLAREKAEALTRLDDFIGDSQGPKLGRPSFQEVDFTKVAIGGGGRNKRQKTEEKNSADLKEIAKDTLAAIKNGVVGVLAA